MLYVAACIVFQYLHCLFRDIHCEKLTIVVGIYNMCGVFLKKNVLGNSKFMVAKLEFGGCKT